MAENDDGTKPNTLATEKVIPPQDQTVQGSKRKEVSTVQMTVIRLTRKQLYDEIWEISAAGTAKKYDIPYSQFLKQIKEANIPIPPSGYWTKISFGKPVEKTALKKPFDKVVSLVKEVSLPKGEKPEPGSDPNKKLSDQQEKVRQLSVSSTVVQEQQVPDETHKVDVVAELFQEPETIKQWGQTYNVYDRETLYKEVWAAPVTEVAKKYKVSDVAIHKVCKSLEIPTPSQGYWAKLRAGKPVAKTPLPQSTKTAKKIGAQTGYTPPSETNQNVLEFLGDEERAVVMAVASQILLPDENERMHSKIIAHRKVIAEWKKQEERNSNDKWRPRNAPAPPFLANTISNTSIPRACRIIDALIKAMEPLGCKLTDNLEFAVNGETVCVSFSESQDKINHIPTKEENRQLLEYEEKRRKYSYASRPQISKYDYQYNGRLCLKINNQKSFRDCKAYQLEDRLGDMMLELYAAAEGLRQQRLAREEAERKRQEDARREEERRKRYNTEVDRTLALANIADDYDTACKIRRYISAYKVAHLDEDISEWQEWANAKADWYDPTISREDELLGKRDHAKAKDEKTPKHSGYWW